MGQILRFADWFFYFWTFRLSRASKLIQITYLGVLSTYLRCGDLHPSITALKMNLVFGFEPAGHSLQPSRKELAGVGQALSLRESLDFLETKVSPQTCRSSRTTHGMAPDCV